MDDDLINFEKAYTSHNVSEEYLEFSRFFQHIFITSDYIIGTGNFRNCNIEMLYRLTEKIKKHPILWKVFISIFGV